MPGSPMDHPLDGLPTAIIVFAHGSKFAEANEVFVRLAAEVARRSGLPARAAFLEITQPDLAAAVHDAVSEGARRIVVAPAFLTIGRHVQQDLPRLISQQQAAFPDVEIVCGESLEGHPGVAAILIERVEEALRPAGAMTRPPNRGERM